MGLLSFYLRLPLPGLAPGSAALNSWLHPASNSGLPTPTLASTISVVTDILRYVRHTTRAAQLHGQLKRRLSARWLAPLQYLFAAVCTLPSPLSCTHCTVHMLLAGAREARRHYFSSFSPTTKVMVHKCFSKLQPSFLSHFMHSCMAVVCRYSSTAVPACLMLRLTVTTDHVSALTAHAYRSSCSCGGVCISAKSLWENRE